MYDLGELSRGGLMRSLLISAAGFLLLLGGTAMASGTDLAGVVADWNGLGPWLQSASDTWSHGLKLTLDGHVYTVAVYVNSSTDEVDPLTAMGDVDQKNRLGDVLVRHRVGSGISWNFKNVSASIEEPRAKDPSEDGLVRLLRVARPVQAFFEKHLVGRLAEQRPHLRFSGEVPKKGAIGQSLRLPIAVERIPPEDLKIDGDARISGGAIHFKLTRPGGNRFSLRLCHARTLLCSEWLSRTIQAFAAPEAEPHVARRLGVLPGCVQVSPATRIVKKLGEPSTDRRRKVVIVYELGEQLALVEVSSFEETSASLSLVWRPRVFVGKGQFVELSSDAVGRFSPDKRNSTTDFFRSPVLEGQLVVHGEDWILPYGSEPPLRQEDLLMQIARAEVIFEE